MNKKHVFFVRVFIEKNDLWRKTYFQFDKVDQEMKTSPAYQYFRTTSHLLDNSNDGRRLERHEI